jgi:predicted TIM-barrel fold metal-dependent hydrolase
MKQISLFFFLAFSAVGILKGQDKIIDIHMHANKLTSQSVYCPYTTDPLSGARMFSKNTSLPCEYLLTSPATDDDLIKKAILYIKKNNISKAVISGLNMDQVRKWKAALPDVFMMGICDPVSCGVDSVRNMIKRGEIEIIGELGTQYMGTTLDSREYDPIMTLAEECDIPVINHCGPGLPGGNSGKYRVALGNPLIYEDVLVKHPKLRICLAHAGWPMADEMIALLYNYKNVYVDISYISYCIPKEDFRNYLKRLIDGGFSKRILFGSDLLLWPEVIDLAITSIKTADFLSDQQKQDIFYNNAVRFLKIKE